MATVVAANQRELVLQYISVQDVIFSELKWLRSLTPVLRHTLLDLDGKITSSPSFITLRTKQSIDQQIENVRVNSLAHLKETRKMLRASLEIMTQLNTLSKGELGRMFPLAILKRKVDRITSVCKALQNSDEDEDIQLCDLLQELLKVNPKLK